MKNIILATTMVFFLATLLQGHALGQPMDFGDAPEGALAYPSSGVGGSFPTCIAVGPLTWIQHTNFGAFFGPLVDFEPDGNGGLCPVFAPYDADECFMDGDAGLLIPQAYTIDPTAAVVPCPLGQAQPALGLTCQTATWGGNVDIDVTNIMPNQTVGYANVLMDWNQDGFWGGSSSCPPAGAPAPEHVLVNFPVFNGFSGPLSALGPPSFLIGPNPGYVWTRFTITEVPVLLPWDGSGGFEDGESEDYLLLIDQNEPTVYPAVETECPEVLTECPLEQTHCPVNPTFCPVINTQCPLDPIQTVCPSIETECPVVETECPELQTICPDIPTWCPGEPTLCPKDPPFCPPDEFTIWPDAQTWCPVVPTVCPEAETLCPAPVTECMMDPTWCPPVETECPVDPWFTVCPLNPTQCPNEPPTACPLDWTFCPNIPTLCPDTQTVCPEVPTVCPELVTECSQVTTACPIDPTFCPELPTECPVSNTQCPVIETTCPTGSTYCPANPTTCPEILTECPDTATQCPYDETNCPTGTTYCPVNPTYCPLIDSDADGIIDCYDNCPIHSNGPIKGTCTEDTGVNWIVSTSQFCTVDADCDPGEFCEKSQADNYPPTGNGIGDACDCEADFNCDTNVDAQDVTDFLVDFGRSTFFQPCINSAPCNGDFNCDVNVDAIDVSKFLEDFGRSGFNDPCPACVPGTWCSYP